MGRRGVKMGSWERRGWSQPGARSCSGIVTGGDYRFKGLACLGQRRIQKVSRKAVTAI